MTRTRTDVRKLLEQVLRSDSDLEAFCSDYFGDVYRRFSNGMDRVAKLTLLLDHAKPSRIVEAMERAYPQATREYDSDPNAPSPVILLAEHSSSVANDEDRQRREFDHAKHDAQAASAPPIEPLVPVIFGGVSKEAWSKIPPEIRTQIEEWHRAKAIGNLFALVSVAVSIGCTSWGLNLGDLSHPKMCAQWRVVFAADFSIAVMSYVGLARFGLRQIYASRHVAVLTDEKSQWWDALEATRSMRAGERVQILGSIWARRSSVEVAALMTTLSIFVLTFATPLVRYFVFGSVP